MCHNAREHFTRRGVRPLGLRYDLTAIARIVADAHFGSHEVLDRAIPMAGENQARGPNRRMSFQAEAL